MNWVQKLGLKYVLNKVMVTIKENPMLSGYRTYIIAALIGIATVAHQIGYIDAVTYQTILGILGAGGLATLRSSISKDANK